MKKLIEGLKHFQQNLLWEKREKFERSAQGQSPCAMLITCSDSRVLPETIMQADPGDLFVSRNAGNLVPSAETISGEGATIEYAVKALGVTDIIVCGHYRCGAVKAILYPEEACTLSKTKQWLGHAAETCSSIRHDHPDLDGEALWDKAVERNALLQVSNLSKHPAVAAGLAASTVRLHAWVLRFETSEVLAYDQTTGDFVPLVNMPVVYPALPLYDHQCPSPAGAKEEVPKAFQPSATWLESLLKDVTASLVVFAVALPLCVAIAKACGMSTAAGIITAVVGGTVVGALGGGPLQVSGPTAGLIAVLLGIGDRLGLASLGVVIFLAGLIQIGAGALRVGQWFRVVSPAVILGMLAGIGAMLFAQQFHITVDDAPARSPLVNLLQIPAAVWGVFDGHNGHQGHLAAGVMGVLTLSILILWSQFTPGRLKMIPGVLIAVLVATIVTAVFDLPIQRVEFESLASGITVFAPLSLLQALQNSSVWQAAFTVAIVGSAETLLTAAAIDQMHTGPRTRYDRELAAQGIGNAICGMLGTLPMASVIVRSSANIQAGAKSRLATILHGVWMLAFVLLLPNVLRLVPTAALAAVLVLTGLKLIDLRAIRKLWSESRSEAAIFATTAASVFLLDLLTGIIIGIVLSAIKLIRVFTRLRIDARNDVKSRQLTLQLEGSATFLSLPTLAAALDNVNSGVKVQVDTRRLSYIDHSCLSLLDNWEKQHQATGGSVMIDWTTLRDRFQGTAARPNLASEASTDRQLRSSWQKAA